MLVSKTIIRESMRGHFIAGWRRAASASNRRVISSTSSLISQNDASQNYVYGKVAAAAILAMGGAMAASHQLETSTNVNCDFVQPTIPWTPAGATKEEVEDVVEAQPTGELPILTSDQVSENNGENGKSIWMSYGGNVYDVTDFVQNHPGGSEKIMMAAGGVSSVFCCHY
jgi:hypothetical protein